MRPDLCATDCDIPPREFLGKIWTDSLVHDDAALRLLVEVFFLLLVFNTHHLDSRLLERTEWFLEQTIPSPLGRCRSLTHGRARWVDGVLWCSMGSLLRIYKTIPSRSLQSRIFQEKPRRSYFGTMPWVSSTLITQSFDKIPNIFPHSNKNPMPILYSVVLYNLRFWRHLMLGECFRNIIFCNHINWNLGELLYIFTWTSPIYTWVEAFSRIW